MNARGSDHYVKVLFDLEQDEDGYPPAAAETLWSVRVGAGLFQIDNIPFFAKGIAYGDIVSAVTEPWELRFREVVRPSGHGTLRLIIYDEKEVSTVSALLEKMGRAVERSHIPGLISVDVPPAVSLAVLKPILDEGEAQERWGYEEACLPST